MNMKLSAAWTMFPRGVPLGSARDWDPLHQNDLPYCTTIELEAGAQLGCRCCLMNREEYQAACSQDALARTIVSWSSHTTEPGRKPSLAANQVFHARLHGEMHRAPLAYSDSQLSISWMP